MLLPSCIEMSSHFMESHLHLFLYIGSEDGTLYALDATTGILKWSYTTGSYIYSSPAVADGVVYVGSSDSIMYVFHLPNTTP